jgi:NAD(P)-dependent dehydrogenase (short-subunit alcohol dehydrogenase family)
MTLPTARDVLAGRDLTGRTALVTGTASGLGQATARALADAGAEVIGTTRADLDLADQSSVRDFAERFLDRHAALDILIANAGVMACPETRVGPGWELQFATNHLGHFALTQHLWPALTAAPAARVVAVASGRGEIRWADVHFRDGYDKWAAYAQSKHANLLFAVHLNRLGEAHGVHAFSAAPGYIRTPLQRHLPASEMIAAGWIDEHGTPAPGLFRTAGQGAATQVWAATAPGLEDHGGAYCADRTPTAPEPSDRADAERLWHLSTDLTALNAIP